MHFRHQFDKAEPCELVLPVSYTLPSRDIFGDRQDLFHFSNKWETPEVQKLGGWENKRRGDGEEEGAEEDDDDEEEPE